MKNIGVFFIIGILLCGCESTVFDELDNQEAINAITRSTDINYTFKAANFSEATTFTYDNVGVNLSRQSCVLNSFSTSGNENTNITPEIVDAPSWCHISLQNGSTQYFVYDIRVSQNTADERSGYVTFKQPGSNKTISVKVLQHTRDNVVMISMEEIYQNRPLFTATTRYPVQEEVRCYIPFDVYNDGGKMSSSGVIVIAKGEKTGTFVHDFNGSPLVANHGNIKGYTLYEGSIQENDNYTYTFRRYW